MEKQNKKTEKNVHTEHCCILHGCKYNDYFCPVYLGQDQQSYKCESCDFDEISTIPTIEDLSKEELEKRGYEIKDMIEVDNYDIQQPVQNIHRKYFSSGESSKIYITSDTHFFHHNILIYCQRPFKNIEEMNETLIENWNKTVSKKDTIIHLGDFAFKQSESISKVFKRLNGEKHILLGNHDNPTLIRSAGFASVKDGLWDFTFFDEQRKEKRKVVLCHYPLLSHNGAFHGRPHLFGHVHSGPYKKFFCQRNSYDVGVDNNNFTPVLLTDIMNKLETDFKSNSNVIEDMSEIDNNYRKWREK